MHSRLETYLDEVAARLGPLPAKARTDELREMRAHLEAAHAAGVERGQSEDEAARAVPAQFGTPDVVGAETVAAWRRGVSLNRRSFWGAAAFGFGFLLLLPRLLHLLVVAYFRPFAFHPPVWAMSFVLSWEAISYLLLGGIVGVLFPRRAVSAVALAWGARTVWSIVLWVPLWTRVTQPNGFWPSFILQQVAWSVAGVSLSLLGAWAGRRWRRRGGRGGVRVARG